MEYHQSISELCLHFLVLADNGVGEVRDGDGVGGRGRGVFGGAKVEGEEEGILRRGEQQH